MWLKCLTNSSEHGSIYIAKKKSVLSFFFLSVCLSLSLSLSLSLPLFLALSLSLSLSLCLDLADILIKYFVSLS